MKILQFSNVIKNFCYNDEIIKVLDNLNFEF